MSAYALPGLFPPLPPLYAKSQSFTHDFHYVSSGEKGVLQETKEEEKVHCAQGDAAPNKRVSISVKEAKVDSALLVQSLANGEKGGGNSPSSRRRLRMRSDEISKAEEEALLFELSVSLADRKYTTTKSWPSILKLRKDLLRNLQKYQIPELPCLHPPGVLCKSLSFMHELVKSYIPTLQCWLRAVTDLVPQDDPILSHFFYEDLGEENNLSNPVLVKQLEERSRTNSNLQLDSIDETEYEEGEDIFIENETEYEEGEDNFLENEFMDPI